ncbi:MAG: regulatory protein RecX [Syntrophales bacterium]|nr:regulatory protein RecX [Syntrophales bacterium]
MAVDPEYEKGLQKAYRLLAVRARSEKELRTKLKEKKFDDQVADRIIARLYELSYLDDEAFARQWARRMAVDKLSGNRRIGISLQEKGVDRATCEQVLAEIRQDVPEREAIRQVIRKKLRGGKLQRQDGRGKRSLAQHLLGRGFTPDLIYEMIREAEEGCRDDDGQSD